VALRRGAEPYLLAEIAPSRWADFVRSAPMAEVRPLGTRAFRWPSTPAGAGPSLP
jgi:hypothetical protein